MSSEQVKTHKDQTPQARLAWHGYPPTRLAAVLLAGWCIGCATRPPLVPAAAPPLIAPDTADAPARAASPAQACAGYTNATDKLALTDAAPPAPVPPRDEPGMLRWLPGVTSALKGRLAEVADGEYSLPAPTDTHGARRLELPPTFMRALINFGDERDAQTHLPLLGLTIVENPAKQSYEIRGFKLGFFSGSAWLGYEMLDEREIITTLQWQTRW